LLVAGTTLPLILFAGGLVYLNYMQDRDAASDRVLEAVRSIRLVLDREMQGITSGLQVLALSPALRRNDFESFRAEVESFRSQYAPSMALSLAEPGGKQILNTGVPAGAALPVRANKEALDRAVITKRPAFSRVFTGAVSGRLLLAIDVPVLRGDRVVYSLAATVPMENFQTIIRQQQPNDLWTIAIFDQAGVNFARVPNPEKTIGRMASPTLLAALFESDEAKLITTSLENIELITAFTRSSLSGWSVAAGIPTTSVTGPLWRTLAITAAIGLGLLAVGLGFALQMASRIARAEILHELLINELNHRVKNTLSTVQALASQTFRQAPNPAEAAGKFEARLTALGRAHNVLSEEKWESADVREIVEGVLESFAIKDGGRIRTAGPEVRLAPRCALMLSMVLHELATNATKYGALSNSEGRIRVEWERVDADQPGLRLLWQEADGPEVRPSNRKGFGSRLIEHSFAAQLGGHANIEFNPAGIVCVLECPLT
jgi:two-component sensor histidine kinase